MPLLLSGKGAEACSFPPLCTIVLLTTPYIYTHTHCVPQIALHPLLVRHHYTDEKVRALICPPLFAS